MATNDYERLIAHLDAFIRKYYKNRLLRGSLLLLICLLGYILAISVGEYFLYMPVWLRVLLVTLFIGAGLFALVALVIIPALKMARLGKTLSHEQAAVIVGQHFPEISDKLLNILQLKNSTDTSASMELAEASIRQKAQQLSVIPFTQAVDLSKNKKYLPYLLPVLLAGIFILVAAPNIFRDASERLLQPTKVFEKPAPFRFVIQNTPLRAIHGHDFTLQVSVEGDALPSHMSLSINGENLPMSSSEPNTFLYTFRSVTAPVSFRLHAAGFHSQTYTLAVMQKPVLKSFKIHIDYPDYTGVDDEIRSSLGDMTLPAGTTVQWAFTADHTDNAAIRLGNADPLPVPGNASLFGFRTRFLYDSSYTLLLHNKASSYTDSFRYHVRVIPDQYPVVQIQEFRDTVTGRQILLTGTAGDDYGISRVLFRYEVSNGSGQSVSTKSIPLPVSAGMLTPVQYYFDVASLELQAGQKLSYYIEAWDNDGVSGSKSSRSETMIYSMYEPEQTDSVINAQAQQISDGISNSTTQSRQLQQEYQDLQRRMLQGNNASWEQQQLLQQLMQKQTDLQRQMEQVKKRFEEQVEQSKQKQFSEDLREKQQALKEQLDQMLDKELREQMKKLEELMQRLNKEQAFKTMQQLEQENKLFNMDMQRMQELMKQLEMQMRLEDMANKMEKLAEDQRDLKERTEQSKNDNATLAKEQEQLKKQLDKAMQQDMKEMQQLGEKMQQEQNTEPVQEQGKDAQQQMQESKDALEQDQKKKSGAAQDKAAQNMQQMAEMMRKQAAGMDIQQIEMDIRAVRQILTNLMRLSFSQEQLMETVRQTSPSHPQYLDNQKEQKQLHRHSQMIRDSLFVLSKRLFRLSATVNRETGGLEKNMEYALTALENRRINDAVTRQQHVMTHTNNLALMLNEMLSNLMQMQSNAQQQSGGDGSCSSPGGQKPKPGAGQQLKDIITGQQNLGNAMQQMQQSQQKGQQQSGGQGEGEQGEGQGNKQGKQGDPSEGEYGDAEQLARMAQQQAALRRKLQELNSLLNSKGAATSKELQELLDRMDRNETDLVNRRFSDEMIRRQREILTRLLETEKSLREQEEDDKRSSQTAKEISRPIPPELQQKLLQQQQLLELYRTAPPQLKPYYKNMVEAYYQLIGNNK